MTTLPRVQASRKTALRYLRRQKPIRRQSAKARRRQREWRQSGHITAGTSRRRCVVNVKGCTGFACDGHHRLPKGRGGKDTPENRVDACRNCHQFCERNRRWAVIHGFLVSPKISAQLEMEREAVS